MVGRLHSFTHAGVYEIDPHVSLDAHLREDFP
jgi:hypothetical protein